MRGPPVLWSTCGTGGVNTFATVPWWAGHAYQARESLTLLAGQRCGTCPRVRDVVVSGEHAQRDPAGAARHWSLPNSRLISAPSLVADGLSVTHRSAIYSSVPQQCIPTYPPGRLAAIDGCYARRFHLSGGCGELTTLLNGARSPPYKWAH